jgi:membrane protease subunit HflC
VLVLVLVKSSVYIVPEGRQAVLTQFGRPVRADTTAGLYFKLPVIQSVLLLEGRLLPWDGEPEDMPTLDKRRIDIDVWARWRIVDPLKYYQAVGTQQSNGHRKLDDYVDSAVREVIAKNKLIEAVRTTNEPLQYESEELEKEWEARREQVATGRLKIEQDIQRIASKGLRENFGMELVGVHIKRTNYVPNVRNKVYERMKSERLRIASLYESEAQEEKNKILGETQRELDVILGETEELSVGIRGEADAEVIRITAEAYGQSPEFYGFLRQLEAYEKTIGTGTRLIMSTNNEFLQQLNGRDH